MPITVYENFFERKLFDHCNHYSQKIISTRHRMLFTSMCWGEEVVHDSPPVLIHPLPEAHTLHQQITAVITAKTTYTPSPQNIMFYYWPVHSYIPWHNDAHMKAGITIHLNEKWSRNDGGLFLYEEQGKIQGIVPKQNLCVMQEGGVMHCTTPVLPRGKLRCTIQVWID